MKRLSLVASLVALMLALPAFAAPDAKPEPTIQIAVLLDTSGSMDGLINQTREQLWRIVNTFATAKRHGSNARLELALYQYGNDGLRTKNWIQQVMPLTTDLDKVSEALFKLKTNGGSEYCGAVIEQASHELEWSSNPGDLKLIYIAGNEEFTQGPVNYKQAVKEAISKGIVVNTIHAGPEATGAATGWKDAAKLADGNYLFIDQNRAIAQVDAPQDAEIVKLNDALNKTYIAYGAEGQEAAARQVVQDQNAQGASVGSMSARVATKASAHYDNSKWDLVDAKKKGEKVEDMPVAALPEPMRAMKPEERKAYVDGKEKERAELQAKISKLSTERETFVRDALAKKAKEGDKTLDDALIESARSQATKRDYSF